MKKRAFIKGGIGIKITAAIVICSIFVAVLVGGVSIIKSRSIVKAQAQENLLLMAQQKTSEFNTTIASVETAVDSLAISLNSTMNLDDIKKNKNNIVNYENNIQTMIKEFAEKTQGNMGAYFFINPELTGEVHGAWYADKQNNKNFERQELSSIEEFYPDNEDMS